MPYGAQTFVPGGTLLFGDGNINAPSISFANLPTSGFYREASRVSYAGAAALVFQIANSGLFAAASKQLGFLSGTSGSTPDIALFRDAAGTLAQRDGTNAQTFRVYETFTDASNYGRFAISAGASGTFLLTEAAGTGTSRAVIIGTQGLADLAFRVNGTNRWSIANATGHFVTIADNTYNIGATGGNRPATLFLGTALQIEADNGLKLTNQTSGAAAAAGTLNNAPSAGNPSHWLRVVINGANRFIPCWT